MSRPADLPEFGNPPLNETVLGVQFAPPQGYQQIRAGEVWGLFKREFPQVQELPPLEPQFETFGVPHGPVMNFGFVTGATHDRFWFLSPTSEELIQFQNDRMLHNWRQVQGRPPAKYPRFEAIINKFERELLALENFFASITPQNLIVTQCEITYINHIEFTRDAPKIIDWLRVVDFGENDVDTFNMGFRKILFRDDGQPQGRIFFDAGTALRPDGTPFLHMGLTARGAPKGSEIKDALDFLANGRDILVKMFAEVTTESAHRAWERV